MATRYLGQATVYGAKGTVTIAGTALSALTQSASVGTNYENVTKIKDSEGKQVGYAIPEDIRKITVTIIVGSTTLAAAKTACALPGACAKLVISSVDATDYAGSYVLDEGHDLKLSNSGAVELTVTGNRYTDDTQVTALTTASTAS